MASNMLQGRLPSSRMHNIYGLGLTLLEIGTWATLENLGFASLPPENLAQRFVDVAQRSLPLYMGPLYCDAALDCVKAGGSVIDGLSFVEKVVKRLEQCQCRV